MFWAVAHSAMPNIEFEGNVYAAREGETVLSCLERHGHAIPSSCRSGVCHSCIMRKTRGGLPASSQRGLKAAHQAQGFFLACQCVPEEDLSIVRAADATGRAIATLVRTERLNHRVLRVFLAPTSSLDYFPGQFVNLVRPDGLVRSFSLASVPALEGELELHVALVPGGQMSGWLHNAAKPGESMTVQGPLGSCFYTPGSPEQPLLLLGTGTGLAPLWGILRDALNQGHSGPIHLFHGAARADDLYLVDDLRNLERATENFHYHPCTRDEDGGRGFTRGSVDDAALGSFPQLKGWRVFLCGNPDLVRQTQRKAFLAGANMGDIHADAFLPAGG